MKQRLVDRWEPIDLGIEGGPDSFLPELDESYEDVPVAQLFHHPAAVISSIGWQRNGRGM